MLKKLCFLIVLFPALVSADNTISGPHANVTGLGINVAAAYTDRLNAGAALTPYACAAGSYCEFRAISSTEWSGK